MTTSRPMLVIVLVAWLLTVLVAGHAGMFEAAAGQPPLGLLVALAAPLILFAVLYRASVAFRRFVLGIDLRFLDGGPGLARARRHVPDALRVRSAARPLRVAGGCR